MEPLGWSRLITAWTWSPGVLLGCAVLGVGYACGWVRYRRGGGRWPVARTVAWSAGVILLLLVGTSAVAVYDDTLFWARSVQGVVLLLVAPVLLAAGAPLTLARATLPAGPRRWLGRIRRGAPARGITTPGVVTILLIAPPFVIYLTGLYELVLTNRLASGAVSLALLGCGLVYAVSRLQIDPLPRRTNHGLTLVIALAEILADGVLGLVLWLGPLVATDHYLAVRAWGPDLRTDQVIGAGIWWLGGDVVGLPFLLAIMSRFAAADAVQAERLDADLDAQEIAQEEAGIDDDPAPARLWWEDDPYLSARFRRR